MKFGDIEKWSERSSGEQIFICEEPKLIREGENQDHILRFHTDHLHAFK